MLARRALQAMTAQHLLKSTITPQFDRRTLIRVLATILMFISIA